MSTDINKIPSKKLQKINQENNLPNINNERYNRQKEKIDLFKERVMKMNESISQKQKEEKKTNQYASNNINNQKIQLPSISKKQLLKAKAEKNINDDKHNKQIIRKRLLNLKSVSPINENFYKRLLYSRESEIKEINKSQESPKKNNSLDIKRAFSNKSLKDMKRGKENINMNRNYIQIEKISNKNKGFSNMSFQTYENKIYNLNIYKFQYNNNNKEVVKNEEGKNQKDDKTQHQKSKKTLAPINKKAKKEFKYIYCVLPGNNSKLIIDCMNTRPKWEQKEKVLASFCNLLWTPLSGDVIFTKNQGYSQYVNHLEYHSELSNKMNLFANVLKYCEQNNIDLFSFFPLTIIFDLCSSNFALQLENFSKFYDKIPWLMSSKKTDEKKTYSDLFILNKGKNIGSIQEIKLPQSMYSGRNLWLIKPVNFNRGRNIKIVSGLDNILKEMKDLRQKGEFENRGEENSKNNEHKKNKIEFVILQKYIENPLLYNKRKFDIRIWVLLTDKEELYVFKEGHAKATCDNFDLNSSDPYIHLTNYSVQKHNLNFSKVEIGNEISFEQLQNELNKYKEQINFKKQILPKIYNIIKITAGAIKNRIHFIGRKNSFELFGYDFLIDAKYNPFLIEVNTNPGYEISSPLIQMLIPRMIDDTLRLTIDVGYQRDPETDKYANESPFEVKGYSNTENMWQRLSKK